jgi:hypothetical protein
MLKSQKDSESPLAQSSGSSRKKIKEINWNEWNPFERATGEALRQLNKRQRKQSPIDCVDEAPL